MIRLCMHCFCTTYADLKCSLCDDDGFMCVECELCSECFYHHTDDELIKEMNTFYDRMKFIKQTLLDVIKTENIFKSVTISSKKDNRVISHFVVEKDKHKNSSSLAKDYRRYEVKIEHIKSELIRRAKQNSQANSIIHHEPMGTTCQEIRREKQVQLPDSNEGSRGLVQTEATEKEEGLKI